MVPPHRRAGGGLEPAERALEPAGRVSEPARRALEPAKRASEPTGRALEQAGRVLEPTGRPRASWEGQLRGRGGGTEKKGRERGVTGMWWYHRSSSPTGPLPKGKFLRSPKLG